MKEITTLSVHDKNSSSEAVIIVHSNPEQIGICISVMSGSDVEIFITKDEAIEFIKALNKALTEQRL